MTTTSKERIFLQSPAESNLIILKSTTPSTSVLFDDMYLLGRSNNAFTLRSATNGTVLQATTTQESGFRNVIHAYSNVTVDSNVNVQGTFFTNVGNMGRVLIQDTTNTPSTLLLNVKNYANQDKLTLNALGIGYMAGSLGIGTPAPQEALHVAANARVGGRLYASNLAVSYIEAEQDAIAVTSDMDVFGRLNVYGPFELNTTVTMTDLIVHNTIETASLAINNAFSPMSNLFQMDGTILQTLVDRYGAISITDIATGDPRIKIENNAYVGIGTGSPLHPLHVHCDFADPTTLMGIYNHNLPIMLVNNDGGLMIGTSNVDDRYVVNVEGDAKITCVHTDCVEGLSGTVSFCNSIVTDVDRLTTCNMDVQSLNVEHMVANYMMTSNWEILGMHCFDSNTHGLSEFHIWTSNLLFTGRQVFLDETYVDVYNQPFDPAVDGKLRIHVPERSDGGISRGINVFGDGNTSIQVMSTNNAPYFEMANLTTGMLTSIDSITNNYYLQRNNGTLRNIEIQPDDLMRFSGGNVRITKEGYMGIRTGATPTTPCEINGITHIRNETGGSVLFVKASGTNQSVGIGTTNALFNLHVAGNMYCRDAASFGGAMTVVGRITTNESVVSTSDRAVKTDLEAIPDALAKVCALTGYTYTRTDAPDARREAGLVAQEVAPVLPEVVVPAPDEGGHMAVAYGNMAALWVEAFKEMNAKIEALSAEVAELRAAASFVHQ